MLQLGGDQAHGLVADVPLGRATPAWLPPNSLAANASMTYIFMIKTSPNSLFIHYTKLYAGFQAPGDLTGWKISDIMAVVFAVRR